MSKVDPEALAKVYAKLKQMEDEGILTPDPNAEKIDITPYLPPQDFDLSPYAKEEAAKFWANIELALRTATEMARDRGTQAKEARTDLSVTLRRRRTAGHMTTLSFADLISNITDRLSSLPYAQPVAIVRAYQKMLDEPESLRLQYAWELHARQSHLPPEDDWDTWLILAGRGFGKTRTGAEWVRAQSLPRTPIRGRKQPRRHPRPHRHPLSPQPQPPNDLVNPRP